MDLILDSIGGDNLVRSIQALAYRGRAITVGVAGRDQTRPDVVSLWRGNNSLQGVFLPSSLDLEPERVHSMIAQILKDVARGELRVVVDKIFPLAEAANAHRYVLSRETFGRVLLRP